ncbi:MAG: D-alanine--D-alanine ligase [Bacilli bacterium]|nr:D-alanine--D-alanine ligase [Bacilli bacterium]
MKKILILFGGNSYEHEISCKSVNFIIDNIDTSKFNYKLVGIDYNNEWYEINNIDKINKNWGKNNLTKVDNIIEYCKDFDVVLPIIHGNTGEDGKLQSLFELYDIKYVGCNSYSSIICYDKLLTKIFLEKYSIPQVPYIIYNDNLNLDIVEYPVIIKPCKCGSSIGINIANNKKELRKYLKIAKKYDKNILIEKYIKNNRELECAILEDNKKLIISDVGEIINNGNWYDYNAKYISESNTLISNIDQNIKNDIKNYSKKIFNILGCNSLSRVDFLYDLDNKKLYFNEINTMPGFTKISMYPKLINNEGICFKEIITKLLNI